MIQWTLIRIVWLQIMIIFKSIPKTTTISQHNSANTITTEISPSLWNIYSQILTDLLNIEKECKMLMQNIGSVMIDMKQHKYVSGNRGKPVEERIEMEGKRRSDHKKREQTRNKNAKTKVTKKDKKENKSKGKSKNKRKGKSKGKNDVKCRNIADMFAKKKKQKRSNDLFVYGPTFNGRKNPILTYPPYHRALSHGYVRQESRFTVPAYIIFLMLSYLCDFSCYKCGLVESKNKNVEVNICNGKCIKFICGECVMSRDGKCVKFCCDRHKKL
eukprot:238982_1